eukprot:6091299-Karenia_brevis.AAC.1
MMMMMMMIDVSTRKSDTMNKMENAFNRMQHIGNPKERGGRQMEGRAYRFHLENFTAAKDIWAF